jgi:hypothetical protein
VLQIQIRSDPYNFAGVHLRITATLTRYICTPRRRIYSYKIYYYTYGTRCSYTIELQPHLLDTSMNNYEVQLHLQRTTIYTYSPTRYTYTYGLHLHQRCIATPSWNYLKIRPQTVQKFRFLIVLQNDLKWNFACFLFH